MSMVLLLMVTTHNDDHCLDLSNYNLVFAMPFLLIVLCESMQSSLFGYVTFSKKLGLHRGG